MSGKATRESCPTGAVTRPAATAGTRLSGRMLLLLIDENFNHRILRGLRLRVPALDVVIVQETAMQGLQDALLLREGIP